MHLEFQLKSKLDERKKLTAEIQNLNIQYKRNLPKLSLLEQAEQLQVCIETGDGGGAEQIAANIAAYYSLNHFESLPKNAERCFADILQMHESYKMPWLELEIERGVNVLVGGQPGTGKTSFAANFVVEQMFVKKKTLIFSIEMLSRQLWMKILLVYLAHRENIHESYSTVKHWLKNPNDYEAENVKIKAFAKLAKQYICIIDKQRIRASQICALFENSKNYFGDLPDFTIIDYIQRIEPEKGLQYSSREAMIMISALLTSKAKFSETNFIILSQLNKDGNFREASAIFDDCGMSIKLEREKNDIGEYVQSIKLIVDKNRFGPLKAITIPFENKNGVIG